MQHKLFPYTEQEKSAVMQDLECSEEDLKEDVAAIMEWFKKQPHLVEAGIDPDVVKTFLLTTKGSREKAKQRIDNFYKYRGLVPEVIQSRIEALSSSRDIWTCFRYAAILRLYEGKRVTFLQVLDSEHNSSMTEELFRNLYMVNDLRVKYDCFSGDIWVVDFEKATLGHVFAFNPFLAQRAAQIFQEGQRFKVHSIIVLNPPSFMNKIRNVIQKFVKPKIMDRVVVISSLEELHKVLPKPYLPKDYGGEDYSMQEYNDMCQKELLNEQTKQFLINSCKYVSDERKRPDAYIDEERVSGTFKKLNLD